MSEDTVILFISSWRITNKLQLMLINMLIRSIFEHYLQGSVSTRLRCDGIFNDQFITQSLLSPKVEKFWKSVNICRSYGQLSRESFFYETRSIFGIQDMSIVIAVQFFFDAAFVFEHLPSKAISLLQPNASFSDFLRPTRTKFAASVVQISHKRSFSLIFDVLRQPDQLSPPIWNEWMNDWLRLEWRYHRRTVAGHWTRVQIATVSD